MKLPTLDLLDFLRTGTLADVKLGMSRSKVLSVLGTPDDFYRVDINGQPTTPGSTQILVYAGIELSFVEEMIGVTDTLTEIYFKPFHLFPKRSNPLRRWLFRSKKGPSKEQLTKGLSKQRIPYQDTGLEMLVWNEQDKNFQVVEYQGSLLHSPNWINSVNECFGTLVLKSGVQIRYNEGGEILRVSQGSNWMIKGKEIKLAETNLK